MNRLGLDLTDQHRDNLTRNLSGLNLVVDEVDGYGDCFFRAIARQLNKHFRLNEQIQHHCSRTLGLGKDESSDTKQLRQLFVKEVNENIKEYKEWMTSAEDELKQVAKFKQDGFFASEVGDLCARATAKLLRIPVLLSQLFQLYLLYHSCHQSSLLQHPFTSLMITLDQATTMPQGVCTIIGKIAE